VPAPTSTPQEAPRSAPAAAPNRAAAPSAYPYAYPPYPYYPYPYYPYPYTYRSPSPPPEPSGAANRTWYGWQTLIVDGVSAVFWVIGFAALSGDVEPRVLAMGIPFGTAGFTLGGPIVHWANGNVGKGFMSFGINVGAFALTSVLVGGVWCAAGGCSDEEGYLDGIGPGLMGGGIGLVAATIVDLSVLAYRPRRTPSDALPRRPTALLPTLDIRRARASVGLMGTF
jgi:hypothetical protein